MMLPLRYDFSGVAISAVNLEQTSELITQYNFQQKGYISFPDVSVIAKAQRDKKLLQILNQSLLTVADGKPIALYGRVKGFSSVRTVSGYWLCKRLLNSHLTHLFLGSTKEKLAKIKQQIDSEYPNARVRGYIDIPFYDLESFDDSQLLKKEFDHINQIKPDLIWIGLSSPKQDYLMHSHLPRLNQGIMLGIGGVFDYMAGQVVKSPEFIKSIGLRWLWRWLQEPRRLTPKYASALSFYTKFLLSGTRRGIAEK